MKLAQLPSSIPSAQFLENAGDLASEFRRHKMPLRIFLVMCLNLAIAPAVQAATGGDLTRPQSWALGLLGLVTLALAVYLFFVMFQPEKF